MAKKTYVTPDAGATWVEVASSTTDLSTVVTKSGDTMTGTLTVPTVNATTDIQLNGTSVVPGATGIPYRMAAGSVSVSLSGTSSGNTSVTFPASRFTATPMVSATMTSAPGGTQKFVPRLISASTSGATMYVYTGDSTTATASVNVSWIAVQMTSSSGSG